MFTSNDLLHLVFADPQDAYFGPGLMKLDLNQYLWLKLHKKFASVYFLSAARDRSFTVRTMGDRAVNPFVAPVGLFGGARRTPTHFVNWMLEQLSLKRSEAAAFVCPAEDFCQVTQGPGWSEALKALSERKGRTGILVLTLPTDAERCRELLKQAPLSQLGDSAIARLRGGELHSLMQPLEASKDEACTVLTPYCGELLHELLLRLQLEQPGFCLPESDLPLVEHYLLHYLRDFRLQQEQALFPGREPGIYLSYESLYQKLQDREVFSQLLRRAREAAPLLEKDTAAPPVLLRSRDGAAGNCLLKLFADGCRRFAAGGEWPKDAEKIVEGLLDAKNGTENDTVARELNAFTERLPTVDRADTETYQKLLSAILFCVSWLYVPKGSEEEQNVLSLTDKLQINLKSSQSKYKFRSDLESRLQLMGDVLGQSKSDVANKRIQQLQTQVSVMERSCQQYHELISNAIINLSLSRFSKEALGQMGALEQQLDDLEQGKLIETPEVEPPRYEPIPEPPQKEEPEPEPPQKEDPEPEPPQKEAPVNEKAEFDRLSREQINQFYNIY